jgi:hypothetical protein
MPDTWVFLLEKRGNLIAKICLVFGERKDATAKCNGGIRQESGFERCVLIFLRADATENDGEISGLLPRRRNLNTIGNYRSMGQCGGT